MNLFRKKKPEEAGSHDVALRRCLSAFDLVLLGVGAIIGAGIFVVTGVAAATKGGPAIALSYVIAGFACGFTALAYAELASSIGGCGGAYGYAYAGLGEFIAWIIGWDLILEYAISTAAVSIGWSGYFTNLLNAGGINLPAILIHAPHEGGFIDLPAVGIMLCITTLLIIGIRETSRFNNLVVFVKLLAIAVFIGVASMHINTANWHPFMPFGWTGVVQGAALIFFAYIGFDAVATASEEAINPQRDLPIGIITSLLVCTVLYIVVSFLLTGVTHYTLLNVKSPVSETMLQLGQNLGATIVSVGAIAGLTTVILVMFYGLSRVFFAMARDGLLPPIFSRVNAHTQTPMLVLAVSGIAIAMLAGLASMNEIVELVNIGTLAAFTVVCAGVLILRFTKPDMPRPFRAPGGFLFPVLGIISCVYLMMGLPMLTWMRFFIWMVIGIIIYFVYSHSHSKLQR